MLVEFAARGGLTQKIIVWLFAAYSTWSLCSASAEQSLATSHSAVSSAAIEAGSAYLKQERISEGRCQVLARQGTIIEDTGLSLSLSEQRNQESYP